GHLVGAASGSFYLPSIWRNEIAYVRTVASSGPSLFAQPLGSSRGHPILATPLPDGPAGGPGPVALDLRGSELAFAWDNATRGQFDSAIYLDTVPTRTTVPATQLGADLELSDSRSPGLLGFPSLSARGLSYGRFDGSAIAPSGDAFARSGVDGGGGGSVGAPEALA